MQHGGHEGGTATVHQGLAGKARVKYDGTVYGGDTAFVTAVLNPFNDTFKDTAWMQKARR